MVELKIDAAQISRASAVKFDSASRVASFAEADVLVVLAADVAEDDVLEEAAVVAFRAGSGVKSGTSLVAFISLDGFKRGAMSDEAVKPASIVFVSFGTEGEILLAPAVDVLTDGRDLPGAACVGLATEGASFAAFVFFATEALISVDEERLTFVARFSFDSHCGSVAETFSARTSLEVNSVVVLAPAVDLVMDDDLLVTAFFDLGAGGGFFDAFVFLATDTLWSVDEGGLAFFFGFADGEGPGVEAAAFLAADNLVGFATFFAEGEALALPTVNSFDTVAFFTFFVAGTDFFLVEADPAVSPAVIFEPGASKYAVKGRCCKDMLCGH